MKNLFISPLRIIGAAGIIVIMIYAFSSGDGSFGWFDIKAASLVFITPIFLLMVFHKDTVSIKGLWSRLQELKKTETDSLHAALISSSQSAEGVRLSSLVQFTEQSGDSFVRYAGNLALSRFESEEMKMLLAARIQSEDWQWQKMINSMGFLAKMAPYFGMLATVIGMISLLKNLNDFAHISGSMALAMQGTLYGLISFTMVYSPMQKFLQGCRDEILRRNEMVARWVISLVERADPAFISMELQSLKSLDANRQELH